MKRLIISLIIAFCFCQTLHGVSVTGYVLDDTTNDIWPGFLIMTRNSTYQLSSYGTVTAYDGSFLINIPFGYYLVFSFPSFETQVLGPFYYDTDLGDIVMKEETSPEGQSSKVEQSVLYDPAGLLIA